jgi:hypothetical protein
VNVVEYLESQMHPDAIPEFRLMVREARVGEPILLSTAAKARMVRPVIWLLQRVAGEGIRLTAAGYLPPAVVSGLMDESGWRADWIGAGNREDLTLPVRELRLALQEFGMIRVRTGILMLTPLGRALVAEPDLLWEHLARSVRTCRSVAESLAVSFLLLCAATRHYETANEYLQSVAFGLFTVGWVDKQDHSQILPSAARELIASRWHLLRLLGVFEHNRGPVARRSGETPTIAGAAFARRSLALPIDDVTLAAGFG